MKKTMETITAAPAAPAQAPVPSNREQGAKLLYELCNADPQEQDRLVKELDAHLMRGK